MKNIGWEMFFALLLGDVVGIVMLKLGVGLDVVLTVSGVVFAILAVVFVIGKHSRKRGEKREAQAAEKIAELQSQVEEAKKGRDGMAE